MYLTLKQKPFTILMKKKILSIPLCTLCITLLMFFSVFLQAGSGDPPFPVRAAVLLIPYGTDNSVSGPFAEAHYYGNKMAFGFSIGTAYQDVFHLTVVNSNPVLGIKTYLRQAELNMLFITSSVEKGSGTGLKKIKGWNVGVQNLTSYYNKKFNAASTDMAPRGQTPGETYLYYPTFYVNTNYNTTMLRAGHSTHWVFWNSEKAKGGTLEYYWSAMVSAPPLIRYEHVTQTGGAITGVAEKSYKNIIGGCVGMRWMGFSPLGFVLGFETGLRPGLCHVDATYGTGTDIGALGNSFFDFKLGISTGFLYAK